MVEIGKPAVGGKFGQNIIAKLVNRIGIPINYNFKLFRQNFDLFIMTA